MDLSTMDLCILDLTTDGLSTPLVSLYYAHYNMPLYPSREGGIVVHTINRERKGSWLIILGVFQGPGFQTSPDLGPIQILDPSRSWTYLDI